MASAGLVVTTRGASVGVFFVFFAAFSAAGFSGPRTYENACRAVARGRRLHLVGGAVVRAALPGAAFAPRGCFGWLRAAPAVIAGRAYATTPARGQRCALSFPVQMLWLSNSRGCAPQEGGLLVSCIYLLLPDGRAARCPVRWTAQRSIPRPAEKSAVGCVTRLCGGGQFLQAPMMSYRRFHRDGKNVYMIPAAVSGPGFPLVFAQACLRSSPHMQIRTCADEASDGSLLRESY